MDFFAKLIIDISNRQPDMDGSDIEKHPSVLEVVYVLIFPSVPLTITEAPANGSLVSLSTTVPDTLIWAVAIHITLQYIMTQINRLLFQQLDISVFMIRNAL